MGFCRSSLPLGYSAFALAAMEFLNILSISNTMVEVQ